MLKYTSVRPTGRILHLDCQMLERVGSIHMPQKMTGQKRLCTVVAKGPLCKRDDIKVGDQVILAPWAQCAPYNPFDDSQVLVDERGILAVVEVEFSRITAPNGERTEGGVIVPIA